MLVAPGPLMTGMEQMEGGEIKEVVVEPWVEEVSVLPRLGKCSRVLFILR